MLGIGDAPGFKFGIDQPVVTQDVEGAIAPLFQSDVGVKFDAQSVRKTCGVRGIARSQAAIEDVNPHGGSCADGLVQYL